jgi:hypothetical protein
VFKNFREVKEVTEDVDNDKYGYIAQWVKELAPKGT